MEQNEWQRLGELASKATPGPWYVSPYGFARTGRTFPTVYAPNGELHYVAKCADQWNIMEPASNEENAAFIAAANPDAITRLLKEREELAAQVSTGPEWWGVRIKGGSHMRLFHHEQDARANAFEADEVVRLVEAPDVKGVQ